MPFVATNIPYFKLLSNMDCKNNDNIKSLAINNLSFFNNYLSAKDENKGSIILQQGNKETILQGYINLTKPNIHS